MLVTKNKIAMKKIGIIIITALLALSSVLTANAQDNKKKSGYDRMKAEKIAYLTDVMDLTPAEAERFWPVYNQAEAEGKQCWKQIYEIYKELERSIDEGKSDSEISDLLDKYIKALEADNGMERKYTTEYRKILSNEKIARLYIGEENFRRLQIHKLNKNDNSKNDKK